MHVSHQLQNQGYINIGIKIIILKTLIGEELVAEQRIKNFMEKNLLYKCYEAI